MLATELPGKLKRIKKVGEKTSASAVQGRVKECDVLSTRIEVLLKALGAELPLTQAALSSLAGEVREAKRLLVAEGSSQTAQERAGRMVAAQLVPSRLKGALEANPGLLPRHELLVGISPAPIKGFGSTKVEAVLEAFAVLRAPAFVASYLERTLTHGQDSMYLVTSALLPELEGAELDAVLDSAASLWDPEGGGAMVTLNDALDAAQALVR